MSHRKRVRAYWNRVAREKHTAALLAEMPAILKAIYPAGSAFPRALVYRDSPLLGLLPERKR